MPKENIAEIISRFKNGEREIFTGIRYAVAGPSFKWEVRCTVLTVGLFAAVTGLGMVIYRFLNIDEKRNIGIK